jgi:probable F420-dependent oxidoreductase
MPRVSPHERPFRFAVQASSASNGAAWMDLARRVESLGYSTLSMPDHFGVQLAPIAAMAAAAAATTTLRIASLVFDNDFRHPVVLAKEIATLDVLSGGRAELGLGAGWLATDYEQSGIQHDSASVRLERMEEGVHVIKGLMADGPFTFEGRHYTITQLEGHPKPVQRPHPPIVMGGGGRRMLSIAGREADVIGINANLGAGRIGREMAADVTPAAFHRKIGWVRDAAGPRFDQIELQVQTFFQAVTDDRDATAAAVGQGFGLGAAELLQIPLVLIGSVDQIVEELQRRRDAFGISYVTVQADAVESFAPVVARLAGT